MQDRILSRCIPEPNSGCWLWLGTVNVSNGYGYVSMGKRNSIRLAHRASYEAFKGPIANGLHIDHLCRTKICVNPDHLEAVTQQVNNQRQSHPGKYVGVTHCVNGHPFDETNTYKRPTGGRACETCRRAVNAAWNAANRERRNQTARASRARMKAARP